MQTGVVSALVILLVEFLSPVSAHEAPSGQDYGKFHQRNGASCCNGMDCRPVPFRLQPDGGVLMYPEGRSVLVPRQLLNELPSDDGQAHWCGVVLPDGLTHTYCAILPRQMSLQQRFDDDVRLAICRP